MRSDWLEAFLIFSESMNFTRAAEQLNISQPALHVKIRKLADYLGYPLYQRVGRNLSLTPTGKRLADFAREQHERSDAFLEELQTGIKHWPVTLCAGDGSFLYLLGPAISKFTAQSKHPLSLLTGNREKSLELIHSGEAHIGVSFLDAVPPGIQTELLTEVEQVLVFPRAHKLAKKKAISLFDLEGEALIVPPANRPHRTMLNHMLSDVGISWDIAVEANGWELMLHFVKLGIGLAVVNGCCKIPNGLIAKPLKQLPRIRYQILYREEGLQHSGAQELRKFLLASRNTWRK